MSCESGSVLRVEDGTYFSVSLYLIVVGMDLFLSIGHLQYLHTVDNAYNGAIWESCLLLAIRMKVFYSTIGEYDFLHTAGKRLLYLLTENITHTHQSWATMRSEVREVMGGSVHWLGEFHDLHAIRVGSVSRLSLRVIVNLQCAINSEYNEIWQQQR